MLFICELIPNLSTTMEPYMWLRLLGNNDTYSSDRNFLEHQFCMYYLVGISDMIASYSFHKHPAFIIENVIRFKDI